MTRSAKFLVAALAVVIVLSGLRSCRSGAPNDDERSPTAAVVNSPDGSVPMASTPSVDPLATASAADRQEARDAAVDAVRATGEIAAAGFITRSDLIHELATERFAPALIDDSAAQLDAMTAELSEAGIPAGTIRFTEFPLTAHVATAGVTSATVEVWSVIVIIVGDDVAPRQVWHTTSIDLARVDGRWLVDGWLSTPGPTPTLATDSQIAAAGDIDSVIGSAVVGAP